MTERNDGADSEIVVPAAKVIELAEEFRERADEKMDLGMIQASDEIVQCAKDLEALIVESGEE